MVRADRSFQKSPSVVTLLEEWIQEPCRSTIKIIDWWSEYSQRTLRRLDGENSRFDCSVDKVPAYCFWVFSDEFRTRCPSGVFVSVRCWNTLLCALYNRVLILKTRWNITMHLIKIMRPFSLLISLVHIKGSCRFAILWYCSNTASSPNGN